MKTIFVVLGSVAAMSCASVKPQPAATGDVPNTRNVTLDIERFQRGIDFVASGNEPFWSLEMDMEGTMLFRSLTDVPQLNISVPEPQRAQDANVTRYRAVAESSEIIVQVQEKGCHDNMSGEKFPFAVSIDVKANEAKDYTHFNGCGRYLPDYRLHDIWVLKELNGKAITEKDYTREQPRMELNPSEGTVMGVTGCNEFSGQLITHGNVIAFRQLVNTKMACGQSREKDFLQTLNAADHFTCEERYLWLFKGDVAVCKFLKVD
ncbi:META domain-containing protein [Chryseolinea lacunae]|uniref:META domain-containing protein n=1 Tax=Chryseolinea lacunae TaxID=2801331 RepID=A0ABS1KLK8_9BACT|nr:META domain-containing protein [Chryseolinea lacunae]MBL0740102.1 META domain-containing protein [Chryseolinea lacunae]